MSKFGEIINTEVPVLINFYAQWSEDDAVMSETIRDVAAALGDRAKVIKIDLDKNKDLAEALRVKSVPTLMIYKNGQMVWRESAVLAANEIIVTVHKYF